MKHWKTASGEILEIKNMTTEHIINCIKDLRHSTNLNDVGWYFNMSIEDIFEYIDAFEDELNER